MISHESGTPMVLLNLATFFQDETGFDIRALLEQGFLPYCEFGSRITSPDLLDQYSKPSRICAAAHFQVAEWSAFPWPTDLPVSSGSGYSSLKRVEDQVAAFEALSDQAKAWIFDGRSWAVCRVGDWMLLHLAKPEIFLGLKVNIGSQLDAEIAKVDAHSGEEWADALNDAIRSCWGAA